ncbi:UDP-N-acetylmuramoyl-tripeptide--D-alanyl-D-alanine ligase [Spongiimicrobium sp. 2-473A-2-J]|uniref:UDP-N-acetylmuramoyl-tripeptide--D-alanyl-D- alanine ligase n=1 Tax=Eudoraea algarum TaxID=3417568 RepID=UPI003D35D4A9
MTIAALHKLFLEFPAVCTDTRKITRNCIFFALKGANFNGNEFAMQALQNGASLAVVDEKKYSAADGVILVEDALKTLQELANYHRKYCNTKVIGLTGSNGKTTTKELLSAVLSKKYKIVATLGNLNNHIGVPLTLLSLKEDTEIAIVEMGANHQGEIDFLCTIAEPDYGYITNFGKAHLEGFGGVAGVIKGKSELYRYLLKNDKHVFLNADDPIQEEKLGTYIKKFGYSKVNRDYYIISALDADPYVALEAEGIQIRSQLIGSYNFSNCAAAVLMGKYFNVPLADIKVAIENYIPQNNRSQMLDRNGHHIILDAYNANPTSMKAALDNFSMMQGAPKIVLLGDMFELGSAAQKEHQEISDLVMEMAFDDAYLVGEHFTKTNSPLKKFNSFDDLANFLKTHTLRKSHILIKGSRGMALERAVQLL